MSSSSQELRVRASERERRNKMLVINKPPHSSHGFQNELHLSASLYSRCERAPCSTLQQDKVIWHLNGIQFTLIEKVFQQLHLWCVCVQMCVCAYSLKTKECVAAEKCWLEEISIGCVASKGKSVKLPMCATTKNRLLK